MRTILTAFLVAIGFSTSALAQELPSFEEVDQNSDGLIDQAEASVVEAIQFETADANQDGSIDREEYAQLSQ
jgi:Ca2+-binding EF-hand superfamily protein